MAEYDVSNIEDGTGDRFNFAAKKLENPVNVSIDGDVVGSASTDLSDDVVINAELSQDVKDTIDNLAVKIDQEIEDREEADRDLQSQIDAISSKSDVVDVVASYVELLAYDTSELGDNDVIKVLRDETQDDAESYYRWHIVTSTWSLIGTQGPFVTPSEMQTELNDKVDKVTGKGLSTNDYTTAEKNKLAGIASGAEVNVNADWNATSGDAQILNKPSTFPPSSHTHSIANVTGLQSALDGKQNAISDIATIRSNAANGQTAYGWGNHANAGYVKTDGSNASGDWPISATKGKLVTRTNFDNLTTSGTYEILLEGDELTNSVNPPTEGTTASTCRGFIEVRNIGGATNVVLQQATFNVGFIVTRRKQNNAWTSWNRITYATNGSAVGSLTQPAYVDASGSVQPCIGLSAKSLGKTSSYSLTANELENNNLFVNHASITSDVHINVYAERLIEKNKYVFMFKNTHATSNAAFILTLYAPDSGAITYFSRLSTGVLNNGSHADISRNPAGITMVKIGNTVYAFGY